MFSTSRRKSADASQLQTPVLHPTDTFKPLLLSTESRYTGKKASRRSRIIAAAQENSVEEEMRARQAGIVACDYILDVCPSLGVNQKTGEGMIALGNNA